MGLGPEYTAGTSDPELDTEMEQRVWLSKHSSKKYFISVWT